MQRTWIRESAGWLTAALISIITVAQVASTARSELLFRDGDSLIVALFVRSIGDGQPLDWAMSSVLFLPEALLFGVLWLLGRLLSLDVNTLLAVNAVLNLVALYGAVRFVAGKHRGGRAPVFWSLIAVAAFCAIAVTETSVSRDSLELASLLLTTTYYSATVIAVVLSVGLIRRSFDRSSRARLLFISLGVLAAISAFSNPLFAAWATAPLVVLLTIAAIYPVARARAVPLIGWLIGGSLVGLVARIPFSAWITNDGTSYAQPALWPASVQYYGELLGQRLSTPLGWIGALVWLSLIVLAVRRTFRAPDPGARLVAASAWALPLLVTIGAVALGTHAARYLEPTVFAPVLALVANPVAVRMPRRAASVVLAAATALLLVGAGLSVPRTVAATQPSNDDLSCVTDWVNASGRTGAGQFWTVRLPKLHLDDPSQLVQVDHQLNAYAWLVNRTDFAASEVTFLIEDTASVEWEFGQSVIPSDVISCGQYTIVDFTPTALPLGPPRS